MAIGPVLATAWLHGDLYPSHLSFSVTRHRKEGVERREVRDVFLCFSVWLSLLAKHPFFDDPDSRQATGEGCSFV